MDNDQIGGALGNATGLTRGLPSWKEGLAKLLEVLIDTPKGAIVGSDASSSPSQKLGELLSALPMLGGVKAAQGAVKKGIKAFHGSPHDFDKFSLSKIGTGEGAQAYGHGLYFADSEDVAKSYKTALEAQHAIDNKPLIRASEIKEDPQAMNAVQDLWNYIDLAKKGDKTNASFIAKRLDAAQASSPEMQGVIESWQRVKASGPDAIKPGGGRMYEVSINADPEDFLDWDAPLSQQSEKVRQSLNTDYGGLRQSVREEVNGPGYFSEPLRERVSGEVRTGQRLYRDLRNTAGTDAELTERLKQAGIPGIKYLDGASRSAGQGSRNYVVFDDALIEIKRKFGFMLPIMGAAGFEQWARQKAAEETGVNPMDALAERKW